jgi:hypothetical protein
MAKVAKCAPPYLATLGTLARGAVLIGRDTSGNATAEGRRGAEDARVSWRWYAGTKARRHEGTKGVADWRGVVGIGGVSGVLRCWLSPSRDRAAAIYRLTTALPLRRVREGDA